MGPEGRVGTCGMRGVSDADGLVLREGGRCPGDIVAFVLAGAWSEIEDGPPQKGADNCLLERGDNAGVDGGVHESVLHSVKTVGEDSWIAETLEGIHKITDRGHGTEHAEVSIVHSRDVAKCGGASIQRLSVHW